MRNPHLLGTSSRAKVVLAVKPDGVDGANFVPVSDNHSPRKTDPDFLILQDKLKDKYLKRISHVHLNLVENSQGRIKPIFSKAKPFQDRLSGQSF